MIQEMKIVKYLIQGEISRKNHTPMTGTILKVVYTLSQFPQQAYEVDTQVHFADKENEAQRYKGTYPKWHK